MILIKQMLQTPVNGRYRTVTAPLCPTPDQHAKSVLIQALETIEIRNYPKETEVLPAHTTAGTTVLTDRQPSASLQSP